MQPIMSAPYTLLVGDTTVHLLSKFSADVSAVVGARVKDGEPELYAMSLVAAQREKEQQQLAQQATAASAPVIQAAENSSPSQPATPTKVQKSPTNSALGAAIRDLWGVFGIIGLQQGTSI